MKKTFYICSYGGCGSKHLMFQLSKYGNIRHIHSKNPPEKLEYIGNEKGGNSYIEWFNGIQIPENEIDNYIVIYLYRNPVKSILSRFRNPEHLKHIQADTNITIDDIINNKSDLYEIEKFYKNYTTLNNNRNYNIYCIKYEDIFDKQNEISEMFGIGELNLAKRETPRQDEENKYEELNDIYKELINTMNNNKFIMIT
jgi:uncharacterized protein YlbG (UPF0298 family)